MSTRHKSKTSTSKTTGSAKKKEEGESSKQNKSKVKGKEKKTQKKQVTTLSVAIYRPIWGNLRHWALYLEPQNYIYQVIGEAMNFTADVAYDTVPSSSGRFLESIHVAEVQDADLAELHRIITETLVQNDVQGWCCQDYVLEALEALNEEQIVDDEDYEAARERLLRRFNE